MGQPRTVVKLAAASYAPRGGHRMSQEVMRVLIGYIKRDLEQLDQMRCELKEVFREYHAAMDKIDAERKQRQRSSECFSLASN